MLKIKLDLTKLKAYSKKMPTKNSGDVDCLIIPVELNHLYVGAKGIYLDLIAFEIKNKDGWLIKQSLPKAARDTMSQQEQRDMPILGSAEEIVKNAPKSEPNDLAF
jgi:hypothetical protein